MYWFIITAACVCAGYFAPEQSKKLVKVSSLIVRALWHEIAHRCCKQKPPPAIRRRMRRPVKVKSTEAAAGLRPSPFRRPVLQQQPQSAEAAGLTPPSSSSTSTDS